MAAFTVDFRKHSGPKPADDMAAQIITDCENFTLDLCLSTLPPDSGTLISKLNATFTFIWKEDHWATVQLFFSLAQVRCFWLFFYFRSGLVALFLKMSERVDSWCTDSSFSSLLVKLSQVFESALQYSQAWGHPCCLCTFSYLISSFQSTLHLICFDTALLEQPPLSVMTLCDLPPLWRVSVIVFCTIAKSAVFSIIVVSKNKKFPQ